VKEISSPEWQNTSGMRTIKYNGIRQNHPQTGENRISKKQRSWHSSEQQNRPLANKAWKEVPYELQEINLPLGLKRLV
jgi:hypothetical protein